ncbi:TIGR02444 family protein [Vibrio sp. Of7-15]|uniref:TIGR02444 family protein n=1 Tax=Vibrio sp. Of7-15 TaxID=2724879 RepID=UPI001EF16CAC|nr:TIGR02444 family protein [Vibrio sp. Of7-15]MCG7496945.1 TIGR02444 family protein [Vibrio sp. Of7-15]
MLQHASHMPFSHDDFWQFSLNHYRKKGVQEACLTLQDTYQGNVNLALLLIWLDEHTISITASNISTLIDALAPSQTLIQPYRALRKQAKTYLPTELYQQHLQFELTLERQQQQDLINRLNQLPRSGANNSALLSHYCQHLGAQSLLSALLAQPVTK